MALNCALAGGSAHWLRRASLPRALPRWFGVAVTATCGMAFGVVTLWPSLLGAHLSRAAQDPVGHFVRDALVSPRDTAEPFPAPQGKSVILAGSCSAATRRQIARAIEAGTPALRLDPLAIADGRTTARGVVEVTEVTRGGTPVRTGRFMASRLIALVEHPAHEGDTTVDVETRRRIGAKPGRKGRAAERVPGLFDAAGSEHAEADEAEV